MTDIERVREICKAKHITISKMEKDLGYANGYFNPKKSKTVSAARLLEISEYLGVAPDEIVGNKKTPTENGEREELLSIHDGLPKEFQLALLEQARILAKALQSEDKR